jgi:hypothetical protein
MIAHFNTNFYCPSYNELCFSMFPNSFSNYSFYYGTQFYYSFGSFVFLLLSFACFDFIYNYLFQCFYP